QDDDQGGEQVENDQVEDPPADLAQVEPEGAQPAQEYRQNDGDYAGIGRHLEYAAFRLDDQQTARHRQRQRERRLGGVRGKIIFDGIVDVREVVDDQPGQAGNPGEGFMGDGFAEGQRHQDDDEDGDCQNDFLQHGVFRASGAVEKGAMIQTALV